MTNKELAAACGVTLSAVEKWTPAKREQAKRDIQAGVNPEVGRLLGELQRECYVAQCHTGKDVRLELFKRIFSVSVFTGVNGYFLAENAPLNPYELTGAIVKVQELYK